MSIPTNSSPSPTPMAMAARADAHVTFTRATFFWALWSVVAALLMGYIWNVRPSLSPNDNARWNTVWSLVEFGTYQIFDTPQDAAKYQKPLQLKTIDKVVWEEKTYSSKPPLLPTVIAGYVWVLKLVAREEFTDKTLKQQDELRAAALAKGETPPPETGGTPGNASLHFYSKATLFAFTLAPFLLFLVVYRRYLDRLALSPFTWIYCLVSASLGTFVTGYLVSINNHTIAACFAFFTVYLLARAWFDGKTAWWRFALAGFCAGWTAANELPAALLVLVALVVALRIDWKKTLVAFIPPLAVVTIAFFVTNWINFASLKPAYLRKELYDYPGSYWTDVSKMSTIDALNKHPENYFVYFFHLTLGHHGLFLLTPFWLFCAWEVYRRCWPKPEPSQALDNTSSEHTPSPNRNHWPGIEIPILGISLVVFAFYWLVTDQRNYGGYCHGPRWCLWLAPTWLLLLPYGVERFAISPQRQRWAWAALLISIISMADTLHNPWSYSWLHRVLNWLKLVSY